MAVIVTTRDYQSIEVGGSFTSAKDFVKLTAKGRWNAAQKVWLVAMTEREFRTLAAKHKVALDRPNSGRWMTEGEVDELMAMRQDEQRERESYYDRIDAIDAEFNRRADALGMSEGGRNALRNPDVSESRFRDPNGDQERVKAALALRNWYFEQMNKAMF